MKRFYLLILFLTLAQIGFAQLPDNTLAPDFTVKDLNGKSYNLYSILNSGKTVFLDVMAAWCGPCWAFHQSDTLKNLYKFHGPAGEPGVDASTTNDVMVFMIETEGSNTHAQLHGTAYTGGGFSMN